MTPGVVLRANGAARRSIVLRKIAEERRVESCMNPLDGFWHALEVISIDPNEIFVRPFSTVALVAVSKFKFCQLYAREFRRTVRANASKSVYGDHDIC